MDHKNEITPSGELPLMESFYTIQGEGYHAGKAAYFIRLAGCDVGCTWCDVKESWNANAYVAAAVSDIVTSADEAKSRMAVITGGEPLMYNLDELTTLLKEHGFNTHLETSGAYNISGVWNWICLSPKKFKPPLSEVFQRADELKIIIYNQHDFSWAEDMAKKVRKSCKLYVQPEWSKFKVMLPQVISFVKNNPRWEISLQVHKFMDIP